MNICVCACVRVLVYVCVYIFIFSFGPQSNPGRWAFYLHFIDKKVGPRGSKWLAESHRAHEPQGWTQAS